MARFRINENFKKSLEKYGQEKAKELAQDAREKLSNHYMSIIDWYYVDYMPKLNKYREPYYHRTFGLYKSYKKYYKNSHSTFYGGVEITADKMKDYPSLNGEGFSTQALIEKFIYNPSGTWHGGDWHGGYGIEAGFSVYDEMDKYYNKLLKEYEQKCSVK